MSANSASSLAITAEKYRNKPFVVPKHLSNQVGIGGWSMQYDGHGLFYDPAFKGLPVEKILDGLADRRIGLLQFHDGDIGIGFDSSIPRIHEKGRLLSKLCVPRGISIEGVTCNTFSHPALRGGAGTGQCDEVWTLVLSKQLKTVEFARAINEANAADKRAARLKYRRVRGMIFWPGGEDIRSMARSKPRAWRRLMEIISCVGQYAVHTGVATPNHPFTLSMEDKPWEPAKKIAVGTPAETLAFMLLLYQTLCGKESIRRCILLAGNPERAHTDMSFCLFEQECELLAACGMLYVLHVNGRQDRGAHDLDLAAMRRESFDAVWAVRNHPEVPFILDVKPDGTDLDPVQRWRVVDESMRSLAWADSAVKFVLADKEVSEILSALGEDTRPAKLGVVTAMTNPNFLQNLAAKVWSKKELAVLQSASANVGSLQYALEHRVDQLLHREFGRKS